MRRWVLLAVLAIAGCDDEPPPSDASVLDAGTPASFKEARRPKQTIYLERQEEICAVYWQADGMRSVEKPVRCPRDLEEGERLRLTGRTCLRESEVAARQVPVRCAQPLLSVEQALEEGKGEYLLAPASR